MALGLTWVAIWWLWESTSSRLWWTHTHLYVSRKTMLVEVWTPRGSNPSTASSSIGKGLQCVNAQVVVDTHSYIPYMIFRFWICTLFVCGVCVSVCLSLAKIQPASKPWICPEPSALASDQLILPISPLSLPPFHTCHDENGDFLDAIFFYLHYTTLNYTILHYATLHYSMLHYTLHTTHYTLHTTHYTLHTTHYTLHTTHYTLHTTHYTLHTTHYTLHTTHYTLHTTHYTLHTTHYTLHTTHYTLHTTHYTLHTTHYTLHTTHYTLHTTHYTLHTTHYTLHTTHYTLHTTHYTLHTTHYTLHTTHYTLHTTHYTLHTTHYTLHTTLLYATLPWVKIDICMKCKGQGSHHGIVRWWWWGGGSDQFHIFWGDFVRGGLGKTLIK